MSWTVYRYTLEIGKVATLQLPAGGPLHVDSKRGDWTNVSVWLLANYGESTVRTPRTFAVIGTGHPLPDPVHGWQHVGSCTDPTHEYVWHVFEDRDADRLPVGVFRDCGGP